MWLPFLRSLASLQTVVSRFNKAKMADSAAREWPTVIIWVHIYYLCISRKLFDATGFAPAGAGIDPSFIFPSNITDPSSTMAAYCHIKLAQYSIDHGEVVHQVRNSIQAPTGIKGSPPPQKHRIARPIFFA